MDSLPHSVLLEILSRLNDSADVARCRVASKAFNTVYPGLRSIHLRCSNEWHSRASTSQRIKLFRSVFLDLISKLETVESICVSLEGVSSDGFSLNDEDFAREWLPRVSASLKSLSISFFRVLAPRNVLGLISEYCHNLVKLKLRCGWISVDSLNPMPMLTSLTLESLYLEDEDLNKLNKCFPNLQVVKMVAVLGLTHPKIHLLNLKTCVWHDTFEEIPSMTIITPNLITLSVELSNPQAILHVEAPMLSRFRLNVDSHQYALETKKFKMKTLWLEALDMGCFLSRFPITKTVENLTLDMIKANDSPREYIDSELFTLGKVFKVFPNVSSLRIRSRAWLEMELESGSKQEVWEILDRREGLKTICAYLRLVDPELTLSSLDCVLEQCVGLLEVSLLVHSDVARRVRESFRSKCMARWPRLKWRWGIWSKHKEDYWITDGSSIEHHTSSKKQRL